MSFPITRCLGLILAGLAAGWPAAVLAKGGGGGGAHGGGGGGHSGGSGHSCGSAGHSGGGHVGGIAGSGGQRSHGTGSNVAHHDAGGYGFGNPANGYSSYIAFDANLNICLPPPTVAGSGDAVDSDVVPFPRPPFGLPPGIGRPESAAGFIGKGTAAFQSGDYAGAVNVWRHAALDDPQNGVLMMKLGQALFATGQYREAAFALQVGMNQLPMSAWGDVVGHYSHLYGNPHDFTTQLRALEAAIHLHREDPALRFVAGFEYGYLGFLEPAIVQLEEALVFSGNDEMTDLLLNEMEIHLKRATATSVAHGPQNAPAHLRVPTFH